MSSNDEQEHTVTQPSQAAEPQPSQPVLSKKRRWPWVLLGVVAAIAVGSALGNGGSKPMDSASAVPAKTMKVVYEVSGTESASSITYSADGVATLAQDKGALPWKKEIELPADKPLLIASLTAQSGSGSAGAEITCRITVDGKVIKTATSKGAYTIAMCSEGVGSMNR